MESSTIVKFGQHPPECAEMTLFSQRKYKEKNHFVPVEQPTAVIVVSRVST